MKGITFVSIWIRFDSTLLLKVVEFNWHWWSHIFKRPMVDTNNDKIFSLEEEDYCGRL